jgi:integrase
MIFKVEKRKKRVKSVVVTSKVYYLRYRFDDMPSDKWISLRVTQKDVAMEKAREFQRNYELEAAGMALPKKALETAGRPLPALIEDYVAELRTRGRNGNYVRLVTKRLKNVASDCGWGKTRDVTPDSFMAWRRAQPLKVKTLNDYLSDVTSFFGWLVKIDRLPFNPLRKVEKIARNEEEEEQRRALTHSEIEALRRESGPRSTLYTVCVYAGLRRKEASMLIWGDVVVSPDGQTMLKLRASTTKNRKTALQPLPDWLAAELSGTKPVGATLSSKVFPKFPRMPRFYKDLEAAGIPKIDERGHVAVFHSLRHTLATWLWETGANPREIQELMRHSTLDQTANRYTDKLSLGLRRASDSLPCFTEVSQISAQISDKTGQNVSSAGESSKTLKKSKTTENKRLCRALSWCGEVGQMVRAAGFEPATPSV